MTIHTCATFWQAIRAIVPNLPADDVARCVITLDPNRSAAPLIEITVNARNEAGNLVVEGIHEDRRIATKTNRFKIVPDEDLPT